MHVHVCVFVCVCVCVCVCDCIILTQKSSKKWINGNEHNNSYQYFCNKTDNDDDDDKQADQLTNKLTHIDK